MPIFSQPLCAHTLSNEFVMRPLSLSPLPEIFRPKTYVASSPLDEPSYQACVDYYLAVVVGLGARQGDACVIHLLAAGYQ